MKVFVVLATLATIANCGLVSHDIEHDEHSKATSYQSIKFEHFHAVPTYIKKEDAHLLEHPIPAGNTGSKLEVHHGGKHDHGYAIADAHSSLHHASHGDEESLGSHDFGGHSLGAQSLGGHSLGASQSLGSHNLGAHNVGGLSSQEESSDGGHEALAHAALAAQALQSHRGPQHTAGFDGHQSGVDYHQLQQAALAAHAAQQAAANQGFQGGHFEHEESEGQDQASQQGYQHSAGLGLGHYH